ncbi:GGDEF domain-containing protein [Methylobacillus gramineus]|uniref:sensor domain-containing diguanylate cyclase n=1 Tax=Methylobacillus gramineus TaxID=755169 RepID=UPI001CFF6136|nr:sensor domain-containing diguanylate cyclase [Methylobacillus gramineus]MCB5185244.1 GGDEF domain-containing protein [Methylobacillus gramineus]
MNSILHQATSSRQLWIARILMLLLVAAALFVMPHAAEQWPAMDAFFPAIALMVAISAVVTSYVLLVQFNIHKKFFLIPLAGAYAFYGMAALVELLIQRETFGPIPMMEAPSQATSWIWHCWHIGYPLFIIIAILFRKYGEQAVQLNRLSLTKGMILFMLAPLLGIVMYMVAVNSGHLLTSLLTANSIAQPVSEIVGWGTWTIAALTFFIVRYCGGDDNVITTFLSVTALAYLCQTSLMMVDNTQFSSGWYMAKMLSMISSSGLLAVLILQISRLNSDLADAHSQLIEKACKDGLTGIFNRGYFDETSGTEWRRAQRVGGTMSVIMLDIDHFKDFNDKFGHLKGDQCLCRIAKTLQENLLRPGDFVARFGGEEFVVLLPNSTPEGVRLVAEKLRTAIYQLKIQAIYGRPVSISAGYATWTESYENRSINELLAQADLALYAAKSQGRNRVVGYEELRCSRYIGRSKYHPQIAINI